MMHDVGARSCGTKRSGESKMGGLACNVAQAQLQISKCIAANVLRAYMHCIHSGGPHFQWLETHTEP
jgi:hypothetical protein